MHQTVYTRPAKWNELRYPIREYDHTLFTDMLYEEYKEYVEAISLSEKVDALADMFFISIGALWKLGEEPYSYLYHNHDEVFLYPDIELTRKYYDNELMSRVVNKILRSNGEDSISLYIVNLLHALDIEFARLGLQELEAELAIHIVCDSNDTKELHQLTIGDKGTLKGPTFVPPTKRLQLLAESIQDGD